MFYAIIATDIENSLDKRLAARPDHLARLNQLKAEGRLLLAGPHPYIDNDDPGEAGFSGSLIVAQFASLDTAQQWADEDPYQAAGVYPRLSLNPLKRFYPNAKSFSKRTCNTYPYSY